MLDTPSIIQNRNLRKVAEAFIASNRMASLATTSDGRPQVAVVYCAVRSGLKIYFSTRIQSRKYDNLVANPWVAMAFHNETELQTLQLTGRAQRVESYTFEREIMYELAVLGHKRQNEPIPTITMFERGMANEIAVIEITPHEMTLASFASKKIGPRRPIFQKVI